MRESSLKEYLERKWIGSDGTPKSFADKNHQLFLAELGVLKVRNTRWCGIGGTQGGGCERGRTELREGKGAGLRVRGGPLVCPNGAQKPAGLPWEGLMPRRSQKGPPGKNTNKIKKKKNKEKTKTNKTTKLNRNPFKKIPKKRPRKGEHKSGKKDYSENYKYKKREKC